ncbi:PilX N-terminal domain-containing pilus assembly protein [Melaminivora alkalimesophila]|uniref:PilX N-terminal domain-containing pilus assembly protein n=1 Tax=Melaminivora alkalimesophila TaxID=1165852 RepID=UPI001F49922F|nr:PilX N-terminal domain-containing pilus assembly protein [Melaminivora alkalimesophila]
MTLRIYILSIMQEKYSCQTARLRKPAPSYQRGTVLVISLILIVILSLLGTFAIRNATQAERSVNGIRSAYTAREAAETALRFCEQVAIYDGEDKEYSEWGSTGLRSKIIKDPVITSEQDSSAKWRNATNWEDGSPSLIRVPDKYFKRHIGAMAAADSAQLSNPPLCVIQKLETVSTPKLEGYLITARGFSNNASFDGSSGKAKLGGEAWMQSLLTRG